jgi:two-component system chemotaxis sensor kinase CheA
VIALSLAARDEIPGLAEGAPDPDGRREALLAELEALMKAPGNIPAVTGADGLRFTFHLEGPALALGTRPEILLDELRELGARDIRALTDAVPPLASLDPGHCTLGWTMCLPRAVTKAEIEEVFLFAEARWALEDAQQGGAEPATPAAPPPRAAPEPATEPTDAGTTSPSAPAHGPRRAAAGQGATLRVPTLRLDAMLDAVGELVIVEARLTELAR